MLRGPTIIPMVWGSHVTFHLFVLAALGVHWYLISQIAEGKLTYASRNILVPVTEESMDEMVQDAQQILTESSA